jgi:hypothetical protein
MASDNTSWAGCCRGYGQQKLETAKSIHKVHGALGEGRPVHTMSMREGVADEAHHKGRGPRCPMNPIFI